MTVPGVERAACLFEEAGLCAPPVPDSLAARFEQRDQWLFSSRDLGDQWIYAVEPFVDEALSGGCEDYIAVGHAGHGINSYAIHYYLVYRQVALFSKLPWGGVYMGAREAEEVQHRFSDYARLIRAIDALPKGTIGPGRRLLVFDVPWIDQRWCRWIPMPLSPLPPDEPYLDTLYETSRTDGTANPADAAIRELTRLIG